jgi:hypothetical protein
MNKMIVLIVTISILAVSVYSSTSLYTVYALRQSGQDGPISSNDQANPSKNAPQQSGQGKYRCDYKYDGGPVTCCERVKVDGQILRDTYCTTCRIATPTPSDCGPRELIMDPEQY